MFKFSKRSLDNLENVNDKIAAIAHLALCKINNSDCKIDFGVIQGLRTQEYQDELYAQGRTKPGKIVTWTRNSKHITGDAIDIACYVNGKLTWDEQYYIEISEFFKAAALDLGYNMTWGGDWKTPDYGHYETN